jgi:hypothetical protein
MLFSFSQLSNKNTPCRELRTTDSVSGELLPKQEGRYQPLSPKISRPIPPYKNTAYLQSLRIKQGYRCNHLPKLSYIEAA